MSDDITMVFEELIKQYHTLDMAEEMFRAQLEEDERLAEDYKEWCDTLGISERKGFASFYEEYMELQGSIWDSFKDHDE